MSDVPRPQDPGGYSYDLATTIGQVRLRCGDHPQARALLADPEIQYVLDQVTTDLDAAAIECLDLIEARIVASDSNTAGTSVQRGQRIDAIRGLRDRLRRKVAGRQRVETTGRTRSEVTDLSADSEATQPVFRRGQFDHP